MGGHALGLLMLIVSAWTGSAGATTLYYDSFSGANSVNLDGTSPDTTVGAAAWSAFTVGTAWKADGSIVSNSVNQHRGAFLPFTPEEGYVYRLSLDVDPRSDWFALGFAETNTGNLAFSNDSLGASPWVLQRGDRSTPSKAYVGPGVADLIAFDSDDGTVTVEILLDTRFDEWVAEWFYNGVRVRQHTFSTNPAIHYVGFGRYGKAAGVVDNFLLTEEVQLGTPRVYEEVSECDLVPVVPTNNIPLIFHRMGSMPPSIVSRNGSSLYQDETLLSPESEIVDELRWCRNAGAVAVMQDYNAEKIAEVADISGVQAVLMVNMSPVVLLNNDASVDDPESVADYFITRLALEDSYPGTIYGQDNRPFLWVFSATSASTDLYDAVRSHLTSAGYNPLMFFHAQNMTQSEVDDYMASFDGALVWGGGYDMTRDTITKVMNARADILDSTGVKKKVVLTAKAGNWRPEKGNLIMPHGTSELRDIINLAYEYNVDALHIESWNDFWENHHVQPSVNNSSVRSDLCVFYGNYGSEGEETTTVYSDDFSGDSQSVLDGRIPEGSTGNSWSSMTIGTVWKADGSVVSNTVSQHRGAFLPFVPEEGHIYELSLDVNPSSDWFALGFTETNTANLAFTDSSLGASPWMRQTGLRTVDARAYVGPGISDYVSTPSAEGWVELKIVLDTTGNNWSAEWFYNGESLGDHSYTANPTIHYVGFGRYGFGEGAVDNFKLTTSTFGLPGLYVSHRREILLGEQFECEVFSLPVPSTSNRTVRLELYSPDEGLLYESDPWTWGPQDAKVKTFQIPTDSLSAGDVISPRLKIDGEEAPCETHCLVKASRLEHPYEMQIAMSKALHPANVQFTMDGNLPGSIYTSTESRSVHVSVSSPRKISRIEIIKNYKPVFCRRFDRSMKDKSAGGSYSVASFNWGVVAGGSEPNDFRGTNTISNGTILDAAVIRKAVNAYADPQHAVWGYPPDTQTGPSQLDVAFEGGTDTVFQIEMPLHNFSATVPWAEVLENGFLEYSIHPHANLLVTPGTGPFGYAESLGIYSDSFDVELPALNDSNWDVYFLRVIAEDGSIYRSAPIQVCSSGGTASAYIWDTEDNERMQVSVPASQVVYPVEWDFAGPQDRILPDDDGVGFELERGGMFFSDGRYNADRVPSFAAGENPGDPALQFDGIDDIAIIRPMLIPNGSWTLDVWFKPLNLTGSTDQVILKITQTLVLILQPDGTLRVWFGDGTTHVDLYGTTQLSSRWHHVTFTYDLNTAMFELDGEEEDFAWVTGLRERIPGQTFLGADVPTTQLAAPVKPFCGLIDRLKISSF